MKKLLFSLCFVSLIAGFMVSCSEFTGKSTSANEVSNLDPKFNGVWQLSRVNEINTAEVKAFIYAPCLKIYNTDAGTFENIRMLPNGQLAKITSGGKVSDVKTNTYVENISQSVYSDVPVGTGITITYEFVDDNTLKLKFSLANTTKVNEEIWRRVK